MYLSQSPPAYFPAGTSQPYPTPPPMNPELIPYPYPIALAESSQGPVSVEVITIEKRTLTIAGTDYIFCRTFENGQYLPTKDSLFIEIKTGMETERKLVYEGETLEGVPHGRGKYFNHNGERYIGLFNKTVIDAAGLFSRRKGSIYEGPSVHGAAEGRGVIHFVGEQSSKFEGYFKNGIEHGYGEESINGFVVFKGYYRFGLRHGKGECHRRNGYKYVGEYINGLKGGYGVEIWPDKAMYKGLFLNGRRHGKGEFRAADGSIFVGEFKNGEPFKGTLTKAPDQLRRLPS